MSQATYYNDNQYEEQGPSLVGPLAATGAWVGTGLLDNWLKKDTFLKENRGLYNRVKAASGPTAKNKVFDQYYSKKFPKRSMRRKMPRAAWTSQAKTSVLKKSASAITSRALGVANFLFLAPMLYGATYHGFKGIQRLGYELERPEMSSGHVALNALAATDRQRAIRAMHDSEFNGRQSLGTEAFLYHQ